MVWRSPVIALDNKKSYPSGYLFILVVVALVISQTCLTFLKSIKRYGADINAKDDDGFTPLHTAALNELPHCVGFLIGYGADFSIKAKSGISAFAMIAKKTPTSLDAINEKFNKCVTLKNHSDAVEGAEMHFDFKTGLHHPKEHQILNTFIDAGHKEFLLHPFCSAYLYITWDRIRRCYYGMICHAVLFSWILVAYILTSLAYDCDKSTTEITLSNTTVYCNNTSYLNELLKRNPIGIEIQWYALFIMVISLIYRKVYGFRGYPSVKHYLLNWGNVLEWHCIIYVFIISCVYTGTVNTWQVQLGGFAVICSSTNIMYLIGHLPVFGPYVEMFQKVQTEFFKLLLVYSSFLLGFTFSFCILFPNSPAFANPVIGFISTIVMMTGDMNYDLLLNYDTEQSSTAWGKYAAQVAYTLFVLYLTIILMNLLVGIAVHDIQGLQKTADLSKLVRQAKVSSYIEMSHFNRSTRSQSIMTLLRVVPKPYIGVLRVMPLEASEERLPKVILEAAFDLANKRKKKKSQNIGQTNNKGILWKRLISHSFKCNYDIKYTASLHRLVHKLDDHCAQIKSLHKEVNGLTVSIKTYYDALHRK